MKRILKVGAMILIVAFGFAGCRTSTVVNVPQQPIITAESKQTVTQDDVYKAISRAAGSLGWIVQKVDDGVVEATLNLREHQAVVTINYSLTDYSITYKSSKNLKYDAEEQTIHSNYNGWVQNLNNAIQVQLNHI